MADIFAAVADQPSAPATRALGIVPHDTNPLADIPKALFVGTGGDVQMRGSRDTADQLFRNLPSGSVLPFRPQYVRATGTTAADLIALY